MKYNLEHFSEIMEQQETPEVKNLLQKNNELYQKLTSHMDLDTSEIGAAITDTKYGKGASAFIADALTYYFKHKSN